MGDRDPATRERGLPPTAGRAQAVGVGARAGSLRWGGRSARGILFGTTHRVLPIPLRGTEAYLTDGEGIGDAGEQGALAVAVWAAQDVFDKYAREQFGPAIGGGAGVVFGGRLGFP